LDDRFAGTMLTRLRLQIIRYLLQVAGYRLLAATEKIPNMAIAVLERPGTGHLERGKFLLLFNAGFIS
jgi:hypothetical protein